MKYAIVGTGGVGGYFGAMLAKSGLEVCFVARGEHFEKMSTTGLTLRSVSGDFHLTNVNVVDCPSKLPPVDVVLLCTKTYDLISVSRKLVNTLGSDTIVVTTQNGIDNDSVVRQELPEAKVIPGLSYIISAKVGPGMIAQTAGPCTIIFGEPAKPANEKLKRIESDMKRAGIRATASDDIVKELWTKLLWISVFAGMTSVCRCSIGEIANDEDSYQILTELLDEGIAVAKLQGFELEDKRREKILEKVRDYRHTGSSAKSSMLIDLEQGRATEVEAICGAIIRAADGHDISIPLSRLVYSAVKHAAAQ
jgi:2-dehydropantoate 2-reductase